LAGEPRNTYRIFECETIGKGQIGRPRKRSEDNIKTDLRGIGCKNGIWMEQTQDRVYWRVLVLEALNVCLGYNIKRVILFIVVSVPLMCIIKQ
jgi:hypothetical protein